MAGRKMKLTTDKNDRADQRERTQNLIKHDQALEPLQPTPPRQLVGYARTAYKKIVNDLNNAGLIKNLDQNVVIELCKQIQVSRSAYNDIYGGDEPLGTLIPVVKLLRGPDGKTMGREVVGYKANDSVKTLNQATAKIKTLSETLGMTPASRASLLSMTQTDDDSDDADWRSHSSAPQFSGGDDQ